MPPCPSCRYLKAKHFLLLSRQEELEHTLASAIEYKQKAEQAEAAGDEMRANEAMEQARQFLSHAEERSRTIQAGVTEIETMLNADKTTLRSKEQLAHDDQLLRLAHLVVSVFELGTRKAERDVIDDLCTHFSLDLVSIECTVKRGLGRRAHVRCVTNLRERVALTLADAASSPEVLMSAVSRLGKPFIAMLEDIYALLTKAGAMTSGTSDNFRFRVGDVDLDFPLSPAFFERVRKLFRTMVDVVLGTIDDKAVARVLGVDGDFYGSWPGRAEYPVGDFTYLPWLCGEVDRLHSSNCAEWDGRLPRSTRPISHSPASRPAWHVHPLQTASPKIHEYPRTENPSASPYLASALYTSAKHDLAKLQNQWVTE